MELINYADFAKVEFRVGEIIEAEDVEKSEKLLRLLVNFGDELGQKIVYSGIKQWYSPADLLNKKTVFVVNMIPKKIMGEVSKAMIFAASADATASQGEKLSILILDKELPVGTKVF